MSETVIRAKVLADLTSRSVDAIQHDRKIGILPGEKRLGVKGYVYPRKNVVAWLKYKGLNDLIEHLP